MKKKIDMQEGGGAAEAGRQSSREDDGRTRCGNSACSSRWFALLKDRRRPMFDGRWACGRDCMKVLVADAIRREAADKDIYSDSGPYAHRIPLGLILLQRGWISEAQLAHALEIQRREKSGRIGYWLTAACGVDKDRITRTLAMQWGSPVLNMEGFRPSAMALAIPKTLLEMYGIVPLKTAATRILYLACADQPDSVAAFAMERMHGVAVQTGIVDTEDWTEVRAQLRRCEFVSEASETFMDTGDLIRRVSSMVIGMQPRAARLVRVHQMFWLRMWLDEGAMTSREGGIPRTTEDVVDRLYTPFAEQ